MAKQPPEKAGIKRLAFHTDDHELQYADFEGEIPEGEFGAGTVKIWDHGEYKLLTMNDNSLKLKLFGTLLKGKYVLCKFSAAGENAWLFFKAKQVRGHRPKSRTNG